MGRRGAGQQGRAQCLPQRAGLRPCCPHLLVDVDGLLVLLQLRRIAGHLQQTLVGRAERGREGQGVSGGGAWGPRRGRGRAGGAWVPVGLLAFVVVCGLLVVGDGLGHTGRGRGRGAQAAFVACGPGSSATPQAPNWSQRTGCSSPPHHWPGWAPAAHLLNVHQLRLVDLGDGDVVLGRDGEAALGET